jgi:hypothetical protein
LNPSQSQQQIFAHDEYSNSPRNEENKKALKKDSLLTKKVIDLIENGLNYLNRDQVDKALKEFTFCEQLFMK